MLRFPNWLIVLAIWAAIYLPALGTLEIKGEEGRRILPAITMLETGNYVVPYVGGEPYLRKPPLINWLVAGSFKLFGAQNEWTARLPSALSVLAVALAFLTVSAPSLGKNGAFFAALMWLTSVGMIEKGRLIEIEALYVSLTGLAIILWLSWWQQRRSPWLVWTVPWIFLGLGLLAKGPLHLLFFYMIVAAVLFQTGQSRQVTHPAHALGVAIMLGIFAAWAVPYLKMTPDLYAAKVWSRQLTGRLGADDFKLSSWIWNLPRAVAYGLPWVLFLFFVRSTFGQSREGRIARGLAWGIVIPFVAVNLLPSALPRYTMPLLVTAIWLVAATLVAPQLLGLRGQPAAAWSAASRLRWVLGLSLLAAVVMCLYSFALTPHLRTREKVRNVAAHFNAALPVGAPVHAVGLDYQPFLFYLRGPILYSRTLAALPEEVRFVLVEERKRQHVLENPRWKGQEVREVTRMTDYRKKTVVLFAVERTAAAPGG